MPTKTTTKTTPTPATKHLTLYVVGSSEASFTGIKGEPKIIGAESIEDAIAVFRMRWPDLPITRVQVAEGYTDITVRA